MKKWLAFLMMLPALAEAHALWPTLFSVARSGFFWKGHTQFLFIIALGFLVKLMVLNLGARHSLGKATFLALGLSAFSYLAGTFFMLHTTFIALVVEGRLFSLSAFLVLYATYSTIIESFFYAFLLCRGKRYVGKVQGFKVIALANFLAVFVLPLASGLAAWLF